MKNFTHIATSSKLLLTMGFYNESDAAAQVEEWEGKAPVGEHDAEQPAAYYTWKEWLRIAEENEFDPLVAGVLNK